MLLLPGLAWLGLACSVSSSSSSSGHRFPRSLAFPFCVLRPFSVQKIISTAKPFFHPAPIDGQGGFTSQSHTLVCCAAELTSERTSCAAAGRILGEKIGKISPRERRRLSNRNRAHLDVLCHYGRFVIGADKRSQYCERAETRTGPCTHTHTHGRAPFDLRGS